ncbi:hypothetical protein BH09ACT7_BH09ACT7_31900 [soil metagenome]
MKRLGAWLGAFLSVTVLLSTACGQHIEGAATVGSRSGDPAFFFAGGVPVYGQTVSKNDESALAYLRAMRRIDVCGFADRQSLAKIGEISSLGTLYAFNECDVEIKMPGDPTSKFVSVELVLGRTEGPPAFRVGGTPIYETADESCEYEMPLDLSHLPGATRLRKPDQPYLRVGVIGAPDCALTKKLVGAIAERVSAGPLPPRDAAAVYPTPLAERDPCEVLASLSRDVDHWDVNRTRPYECEFSIWRDGYPEVLSIRVALEPKIVDITTDDKDHRVTGGTDVYLDQTFCSAVAFVGPAMQRRLAGGDFVDVANVVARPAVVVDGGDTGCDAAVEIAAIAAKLYT